MSCRYVATSSCETKGSLGNQRGMKDSGSYYWYGADVLPLQGIWYRCGRECRSLISLCFGVTSKESICSFKENGAFFFLV